MSSVAALPGIWLAALSAACVVAAWRATFWIRQGRRMRVTGHLPPRPSWPARLFLRGVCRTLVAVFVGPLEVRGREHVPRDGRVLVACNHSFGLDFALAQAATRLDFRFLTKVAQLPGLRGILGAWTGAIPVDTGVTGGGAAAIAATVEALLQSPDGSLLVFPQGRLVRDNVLRPGDFRTGLIRIGRGLQARRPDASVAVLPVAVHYRAHPRWTRWPHARFRSLGKAFAHAHGGAIVVVGEPIAVRELPEDPALAIESVRQSMSRCLRQAQEADLMDTAVGAAHP